MSSRVGSASHPRPPLDLLATRLAHLVSLQPFSSIPASTVPLLSEITHHYLSLLARIAAGNAQQAGRSSLVVWDMMAALTDVGAGDVAELGCSGNGWMAQDNEVRRDWKERVQSGWADEGARQQDDELREAWKKHIRAGWNSIEPLASMKYTPIPREDLEDWQELRIRDECRLPPRKRIKLASDDASRGSRPTFSSRSSDPAKATEEGTYSSDSGDADETDSSIFDRENDLRSTGTSATLSPLLPDDQSVYKERQLTMGLPAESSTVGDEKISHDQAIVYIPWFLPPLPGHEVREDNRGSPTTMSGTIDVSTFRQDLKEEATAEKSAASVREDLYATARTSAAEIDPQGQALAPTSVTAAEGGPEAPTSSYFSEPITFQASTLFNEASDLLTDETKESSGDIRARNLPSLPGGTDQPAGRSMPSHHSSSVPALAAALSGLASSGEVPAFLPMSSTAGGKIRRRLASLLCQPSRFNPSDVLYASLPARPSSMPFVPGPSHLVTLPPAGAPGGGAPRFTPTRPRGRPLSLGSSGGDLGGASQPVLGYRHPRMASEVARYLLANAPVISQRPLGSDAGGDVTSSAAGPAAGDDAAQSGEATIRSSTLHRSLHIYDPEPLRDDAHVERVFRGITLGGGGRGGESDSLLRRGESCYKAAVDALRISTGDADAAAAAADISGGSSSGLGKSGPKGPMAGTVVYTWDWTSRDYTDAAR